MRIDIQSARKLLAAILLAPVFNAGATTNLPSVVVNAVSCGVRSDDTTAFAASSVEVFDAAAIAASRARDLPELLTKAANVQVRTLNANPLQTQIAMGGFGENSFGRVKILVDGEELNTVDLNAPDLASVSLETISRVEIIHGPSAVLYGDGAEAGVILISTEPPDYSTRTRLAANVGSYGTAGASVMTHGGLSEEGIRYSSTYRYERSDGYRSRSGYDLHTLTASLWQDFENESSVGLRVNYANALYQMPGALSWEEWRDDPRQAKYDDDWCRLWNYGLTFDSKIVLADDRFLRLNGAFSVKHRSSHWGDYGYENDYDLYTYRFSPRYIDKRALGNFDNRLTLGLDAGYDHYAIKDRSGFNNSDYRFARWRGGVFALDEFSPIEDLSVVAGARFEGIDNRWSHYRNLSNPHSTDFVGDYEVGLVYRPWTGMKLHLKGSRFHKSAFCDEMNYTENGEFLKPERGTSVDFGLSAEFADAFQLTASGFISWLDDEIFYNPYARDFGGLWSGFNCNSPGRTERRGFNLNLAWKREKVAEFALRSSLVDARFTSGEYSGKRVPVVPRFRLRAEAGVWLGTDFKAKGGCCFVSDQVLAGDYYNEVDRLSEYTIFDLAFEYAPSWAEGWKLSFVIDNLFDRAYCDFAGWSEFSGAYYYPAAGRSFRLSLGYEW